jgi:hypothetical protein
MKALIAGFAATIALVLVLGSDGAGGEKEPKFKIKEVMKKAMAGGLCKKCASGQATAEEKKQLVEMFVALHDNAPPKGEKDSWAKVTKALVDAAKAVEAGTDEKAGKALAMLVNCKACHGEFKK